MMRVVLALTLLVLSACQSDEPELGPVDGRFIINADPQMGPADSPAPIIQRLNKLLEDFVFEINERHEDIDFVLFNGDMVSHPNKPSFDNFVNLVRPLKMPVHPGSWQPRWLPSGHRIPGGAGSAGTRARPDIQL